LKFEERILERSFKYVAKFKNILERSITHV